jgi:hypothetical protein
MNAKQQSGVIIIQPQSVLEGAGVRLQRSLGTSHFNYLDPFLLFDDFSSPNTADYVLGFPWHPHRGIETVTYILSGQVRHLDSLGNGGTLGAGEVQWMSAGSGIMHEEMPQPTSEPLVGFQLWVNLPAREKMSTPRYQNIPAQSIPAVSLGSGVTARIVAGSLGGVRGPVTDIAVSPTYWDIALEAGAAAALSVSSGDSAFAYVFQGDVELSVSEGEATRAAARCLAVVQGAHDVRIAAGSKGARLLWVAGSPLHEPIARYGPFVMNTREEIQQALTDLQQGTFIRAQPRSDPSQWYGAHEDGGGAR